MTSVLILEFDKVLNFFHPDPPKTIRDVCYRTFPKVQWNIHAKNIAITARKKGIPVILVAHQNEALVKEAIYRAKLCPYFDYFVFLDEFDVGTEHFHNIVMIELAKKHGLCRPIIYKPTMLLSPSACI